MNYALLAFTVFIALYALFVAFLILKDDKKLKKHLHRNRFFRN